MEADCRTSISGYIDLPSFEALRAFVIRCNPQDIAHFDYCIPAWNKGQHIWLTSLMSSTQS
jgi:hypothetical protein